ncbi:uncharacterized protein [Palaemon carinicauda]|uniref:uncharacterized protein n=1 Tax=Palaemon carinicauda TaxID=392227 RepID=UPI0035B677EB
MVDCISSMLTKKQTRMRDPLSVEWKLAVTLPFLASGDPNKVCNIVSVSKGAIYRFVPEVFYAVIDTYQYDFRKWPKTPEEWKTVAEVFAKKWNYYNFVVALNGKHVPIQKTKKG